jgi:hypothetical protein
MQKLRKLPFILAFVVMLITAACSEVDVAPRADEDNDPPVLPPPTKSSTVISGDTLTIG